MIDIILWVGITILQIINITALIYQYKMINKLENEKEELQNQLKELQPKPLTYHFNTKDMNITFKEAINEHRE